MNKNLKTFSLSENKTLLGTVVYEMDYVGNKSVVKWYEVAPLTPEACRRLTKEEHKRIQELIEKRENL